MGLFPMSSSKATSDKWEILPDLSSYSSFNNIPYRKVETCKARFSHKHKKKCGEKIIPHSFELHKTRGKDKFPIVLNCKSKRKRTDFINKFSLS